MIGGAGAGRGLTDPYRVRYNLSAALLNIHRRIKNEATAIRTRTPAAIEAGMIIFDVSSFCGVPVPELDPLLVLGVDVGNRGIVVEPLAVA